MNLRPLSDRILIKRIPEQESFSPIIVPEVAQKKSLRGVVISVGPGKRHPETGEHIGVDVAPGQVVYFGPYTDESTALEDGYVMIREADVRVIVEGDAG